MSNSIPLRNDHYVYILGAGFSAARGLPLISDFLNHMRDAALWCEREGRANEVQAIHDVLRFRLDAAAAAYRVPIDLENIEELFSLASAADHRITKSVKLSIAATLAYCEAKKPTPHLRFNDRDASTRDFSAIAKSAGSADAAVKELPLYDAFTLRLLQAKASDRTSIITFNYDNLLESSIERIGGSFHYGFSEIPDVEGGVPYDGDGVAILKLHGSVNWAANLDAKGKEFTVFKNYGSVFSRGLVPQIVPPTWNKTFADRLAEVWFSAIERLSTATKIVVVGFSMPRTDLHFKYLLAAGMKSNFSLREIVFIDPSSEVRARASEVIADREVRNGRVRFVELPVAKLLGDLVDKNQARYKYLAATRPF